MASPESSLLALGDRNRLLLLRLLLVRAYSVGELTRISGLGQSLVSHHLAVLARNGWVKGERSGRRRIYRAALAGSPLAPVGRWIRRQVSLPADWEPVAEAAGPAAAETAGRAELEDFLL